MERSIIPLALLSFLLCACGPSGPATPSPSATPSSSTPTSSTAPSPTPSASSTTPTNAACNEIAFYLDPALASSALCETVPAETGPVYTHPEMTVITLVGYLWSGGDYEARIYVMSVADYTALRPTQIPMDVANLQGWISSATPPVYPTSGFELPTLPDLGGMPSIFAQYGVLPFADGVGIRFVTRMGYDAAPISNYETKYTYQALTADGQYWVSAFLPIRNTILVDDGSTLPAGYATWAQFEADVEAYWANVVQQLNTQPPGTFEPLIADLDVLVSSITFVP